MYRYEEHLEWLASTEGMEATASVLNKVLDLLPKSGAVMMCKIWPDGVCDSDRCMAAVDQVVALRSMAEVRTNPPLWGQHRVFIDRATREGSV